MNQSSRDRDIRARTLEKNSVNQPSLVFPLEQGQQQLCVAENGEVGDKVLS